MRRWVGLLLALLMLAAVAAAGCGDSGDSGDGGGGSGAAELTAQDIIAKSNAAMADIASAAFTMDLSMTVQGDASQVTDEQTKQLLSSPITVKADGKVGNEPQKLDMTLAAKAMGQSFDIGMKMDAEKVYLSFMEQWYEIPKDMAESMTGASPAAEADQQKLTDMYKQLGIDPNTWAAEYTVVGEEDVNGVSTYHVSQAVDMEKVATDISKLANSASGLGSLVGGGTESADPEDVQKAVEILKTAVKDVKIDWWVGKDDFYLYKMTASAMMDMAALPAEDREGAEGVDSVDFSLMMGMSEFNQDFTVEPPASAQPFEQMMNDLMQSGGLSL